MVYPRSPRPSLFLPSAITVAAIVSSAPFDMRQKAAARRESEPLQIHASFCYHSLGAFIVTQDDLANLIGATHGIGK